MVPDGRIHQSNSAVPRPASAAAGDFDPESPRRDTLTGEVGPAPFIPPTLLPLQNPLYRPVPPPGGGGDGGPSRLPRPPGRGHPNPSSVSQGGNSTSGPLPPPPLLSTGFSATSLPQPGFLSSSHHVQQSGQSGMLLGSMPLGKETDTSVPGVNSWDDPSYAVSQPPMPWTSNNDTLDNQGGNAADAKLEHDGPPLAAHDFMQQPALHNESNWLTGEDTIFAVGNEDGQQVRKKLPPPASSLDGPFKAQYAKGSPFFQKTKVESPSSHSELKPAQHHDILTPGALEGEDTLGVFQVQKDDEDMKCKNPQPLSDEAAFHQQPPPPATSFDVPSSGPPALLPGPPVAFATFPKPDVARSASGGSNGGGAALKFGLPPMQHHQIEDKAPAVFKPMQPADASSAMQKDDAKQQQKQQQQQQQQQLSGKRKVQKRRRSTSFFSIGRLVKLFWLGFFMSAFINPTWLVNTITTNATFGHVMVSSLRGKNYVQNPPSTTNIEFMKHLDAVSRSQWQYAQRMMPCEDAVPACRLSKRALHGAMTTAVLVKEAAYYAWSAGIVPLFSDQTVHSIKNGMTWLKDSVSTQENRQALVADVSVSIVGAKELGMSFARWFRCLGQHLQQSGVHSYDQVAQPAAGCWREVMKRYLSSSVTQNIEGNIELEELIETEDNEASERTYDEESFGNVTTDEIPQEMKIEEGVDGVEEVKVGKVEDEGAEVRREGVPLVMKEGGKVEREMVDTFDGDQTETVAEEASQKIEPELVVDTFDGDQLETGDEEASQKIEPELVVDTFDGDQLETGDEEASQKNEPELVVDTFDGDQPETGAVEASQKIEPELVVDTFDGDQLETGDEEASQKNEPELVVDTFDGDQLETGDEEASQKNEPELVVDTFDGDQPETGDEEASQKIETELVVDTFDGDQLETVAEEGQEVEKRTDDEIELPAEQPAMSSDHPKESADASLYVAEKNSFVNLNSVIDNLKGSFMRLSSNVARQATARIAMLQSKSKSFVQSPVVLNMLRSLSTILPMIVVSFLLGMAFSWRGGVWNLFSKKRVDIDTHEEKQLRKTPRTPASFRHIDGGEAYFSARSAHGAAKKNSEIKEVDLDAEVDLGGKGEEELVTVAQAPRRRESSTRGRRTVTRKSDIAATPLDAEDEKRKTTRRAVGSNSSSKGTRNRSQSRTRKSRGL